MVVGNNKSTATKNAGKSMAISIAMVMQRYNAGYIARWSTSWASLEATGCCHRSSACTVSFSGRHGRRFWLKTQNTNKNYLVAS